MSEDKRKPGRPFAAPGARKSEPVQLRLTPAHRDKLAALGGVEWVRQQIERARVTARPAQP